MRETVGETRPSGDPEILTASPMALSWCTRRISNGCTKKGYIAKLFGCLEAIICDLNFELFFGDVVFLYQLQQALNKVPTLEGACSPLTLQQCHESCNFEAFFTAAGVSAMARTRLKQ